MTNVVTIIADDMGYWACGRHAGNKEVIAPNLDRLADFGTFFDNCYCVSPVCSPARASIYSGTIPSYHGVLDWIASGNVDINKIGDLKTAPEFHNETDTAIQYIKNVPTFSEMLHDKGYHCSLSGKWHLGDSMTPQKGFSDWFTIARGGCEYNHPDVVENGHVKFRNQYISDLITEDALRNLDQFGDGKNHYLNVTYTAPHSPWDEKQGPARIRRMYDDCPFESVPNLPVNENQVKSAPIGWTEDLRREYLTGYYSAITAMDEGIGKILDKLKAMNQLDDTLIIFTGDNGMNMGHHGIWGKGNGTWPLNMYQSSVKVPLIISWPKQVVAGQHADANVSHYDILPTLVDLLDLPTERLNQAKLPGKSLRNVLAGGDGEDRNTFIFDEYGATRMISNKHFKLIKRFANGPDEFYDLVADPDETRNLIDEPSMQAEVGKLYRELMQWFNHYVSRDVDGLHEGVTGFGQMKEAGWRSDGQHVYRPIKYPTDRPTQNG